MPPKIKTTQEDIILAAIHLTRNGGWDSVNARSLAKELGCSTQPIFRAFGSMEELKEMVYKRVEDIYNNKMEEAMKKKGNSFSEMGLTYINFARNEKNLFKLLFMSDSIKVKSVREMIQGDGNDDVIQLLSSITGLKEGSAEQLYINIWLVTHGIASMLATNSCSFSEEEVQCILGDCYKGIVSELKKKEN